MIKVIFATQNKGKIKEIREIMQDMDIDIITMEEAGINIQVIEDGKTFEENAIKKAEEIMKISGAIVLADDSGLEIDYFNGKPGVYSARYLGENTPYEEKNAIILDQMKDVSEEKRGARFICVIAAAFPNRETIITKGIMEGIVGYEPIGTGGFGYDPIFYMEEFGTSTANIPAEVKNKISHRGKALKQMKTELKRILES